MDVSETRQVWVLGDEDAIIRRAIAELSVPNHIFCVYFFDCLDVGIPVSHQPFASAVLGLRPLQAPGFADLHPLTGA
jgi:hypothetical protein